MLDVKVEIALREARRHPDNAGLSGLTFAALCLRAVGENSLAETFLRDEARARLGLSAGPPAEVVKFPEGQREAIRLRGHDPRLVAAMETGADYGDYLRLRRELGLTAAPDGAARNVQKIVDAAASSEDPLKRAVASGEAEAPKTMQEFRELRKRYPLGGGGAA